MTWRSRSRPIRSSANKRASHRGRGHRRPDVDRSAGHRSLARSHNVLKHRMIWMAVGEPDMAAAHSELREAQADVLANFRRSIISTAAIRRC